MNSSASENDTLQSRTGSRTDSDPARTVTAANPAHAINCTPEPSRTTRTRLHAMATAPAIATDPM